MWSVVSIPALLACPGCSMFNLIKFQFREPGHAKWAIVVVASALAVPLSMYLIGFRLGPARVVTKRVTWTLATLQFVGWLIMAASGAYAPNFCMFLMHWIYLPLTIQWNVIMVPAWSFPILLILSGLVIPAWYCFYFSRWLLRHDRVIVWRPWAQGA